MATNNEADGIAAEVAICQTFNIFIDRAYASRADQEVLSFLLSSNAILPIFQQNHLPRPTEHIAQGQNPIDFNLEGGKTLSVKTNQQDIGKAAPQNIGQPTQRTFFNYLEEHNIIPGFSITKCLAEHQLADTYENRSAIFKNLVFNHIDRLVDMYWHNMFDCDYLLLFFNLENYLDPLNNYRIFGKEGTKPRWDKTKFSFTRTPDNWNESTTLKYANITIGEFQVHRNRGCFKFRFNMKGVKKLLEQKLI